MRLLSILLLSSQVLTAGCLQSPPPPNATEVASQHPEVAAFLRENPDASVRLQLLTVSNRTQLAEKYPVVYGNLPDQPVYEVRYEVGNRGILALVDPLNQSVVRVFKTTGITLS